jgi:hypothetical protein
MNDKGCVRADSLSKCEEGKESTSLTTELLNPDKKKEFGWKKHCKDICKITCYIMFSIIVIGAYSLPMFSSLMKNDKPLNNNTDFNSTIDNRNVSYNNSFNF